MTAIPMPRALKIGPDSLAGSSVHAVPQELKAALQAAVSVLSPPKTTGEESGGSLAKEVQKALVLTKGTLLGQTCASGAHVFNTRQICLVLLRLLKLLPEPAFEGVSTDLLDVTAHLVDQLACRDPAVFACFIADATLALRDLQGRPSKLIAFRRFMQFYNKERLEEVPATATSSASQRALQVLSLELGTTPRFSTFCRRFFQLISAVAATLPTHALATDLERLLDTVLTTAAVVITWTEQEMMELSQACHALAAILGLVRAVVLWPSSRWAGGDEEWYAVPSETAVSLYLQLRVLEELPGIAMTLLRYGPREGVPVSDVADVITKVIATFDIGLLLPSLDEVLLPCLQLYGEGSLRPLAAAASRLHTVGRPLADFWQILFPVPADAGSNAPETNGLGRKCCQEPWILSRLASIVLSLGSAGVGSLAKHASTFWRSRSPQLEVDEVAAADNFSSMMSGSALLALVNLCKEDGSLASQKSPNSDDDDLVSLLRRQTKALLGQPLSATAELSNIRLMRLNLMLESMRGTPQLVAGMECDGQDFAMRMLEHISTSRPKLIEWEAVLASLRLFVAEAAVPLAVKFGILRPLIQRSPSQSQKPLWIQVAAWAMLSEATVHTLHAYAVRSQVEEGNQSVSETCKLLLASVHDVLTSSPMEGSEATLALAIAYLLPLVTTLASLAGSSGSALPTLARLQAGQGSCARPAAGALANLRGLRTPIKSLHNNTLKTWPSFAGPSPTADAREHSVKDDPAAVDSMNTENVLFGACAFCPGRLSRVSCISGTGQQQGSHPVGQAKARVAAAPSGRCKHCGMPVALWIRWDLFQPAVQASKGPGCSNPCLEAVWMRSGALDAPEDYVVANRKMIERAHELASRREGSQQLAAETDTVAMTQWLLMQGLVCISMVSRLERIHTMADALQGCIQSLLALSATAGMLSDQQALCKLPLIDLVQSDMFVKAILGDRSQGAPTPQMLSSCLEWRLKALGPSLMQGSGSAVQDDDVGGKSLQVVEPASSKRQRRGLSLGGLEVRALQHHGPLSLEIVGKSVAELLAGVVTPLSLSELPSSQVASRSLQSLLAFCLQLPVSSNDLLLTVHGPALLHLFGGTSKRSSWVAQLCPLLLEAPLRSRIRLLLPRLLPNLVLARNLDAIQNLSAMLDESIPSMIRPQLPFILSAAARQEVGRLESAFTFILEHIYSHPMTIADLCEASLGKSIVLILWDGSGNDMLDVGSMAIGGSSVADRRTNALKALGNIASVLRSHGNVANAKEASTTTSTDKRRKRKVTDVRAAPQASSVMVALGAGLEGSPMKKRAVGPSVRAEATSQTLVPGEVVEMLEGNFLHILDILELVLKEPEKTLGSSILYQHLIAPGVGTISKTQYFTTVSFLLRLIAPNLHVFAPKVFEFLQAATAFTDHVSESIECWQVYVESTGIQRLQALVPAVVCELLRLASKMREGDCNERVKVATYALLTQVVQDTCKANAELAGALPVLPGWAELQPARAAMGGMTGRQISDGNAIFITMLKASVQQLKRATQYAIKSAALETITGAVIAEVRKKQPCNVGDVLGSQLLSALLQGIFTFLWESAKRPHDLQRCGELLGALGAFDPDSLRVPQAEDAGGRANSSGSSSTSSTGKIRDQTLGPLGLAQTVLLDYLVPKLGASNAYAFAVQEILKYLQQAGQVDNLFGQLKDDMRQTLAPYRSTSYKLVDGALSDPDLGTFEGILASAVKSVEGQNRPFFEACLPAVLGNNAFALFVMQQVLQQLLSESTSTLALEKLSVALASLLLNDSASHATAQAVFALFDDLTQRREDLDLKLSVVGLSSADVAKENKKKDRLSQLLSHLSPRRVAEASMRHGSYARALRCLEDAIVNEHRNGIQGLLDEPKLSEVDCFTLQEVHTALDEPQGVLGALRVGPASTKTRSLLLEQNRQWQDVISSYEEQLLHLPRTNSENATRQRHTLLGGLVRCTRQTRNFETLSSLVHHLGHKEDEDEESSSHLRAMARPHAIEAAWQLSNWSSLEEALASSRPRGQTVAPPPAEITSQKQHGAKRGEAVGILAAGDEFQERLGQALLAFHLKDSAKLKDVLGEARLEVTRAVASAARESYVRAYPHLLHLHMLSDLEWLQAVREDSSPAPTQFADHLLRRAEAASASSKDLVLSPLRVALADMGRKEDAKRIELALVRMSRKSGMPVFMEHPSTGYADVSKDLHDQAQLEWGRLLYARGPRQDALKHMQQLGQTMPRALLIHTRWATEADSELLIPRVAEAEFKKVQESLRDYEAAWFHHAAYLDQILKEQMAKISTQSAQQPATESKDASTQPGARDQGAARAAAASSSTAKPGGPFHLPNLAKFTIKGYLQALQCGTKRLHFILNRVLQLVWECSDIEHLKVPVLTELRQEAGGMQAWMWYVVLPQLLSRVHDPYTQQLFSDVIVKVVRRYPRQAGWQMMQLLYSNTKEHRDLGKRINAQIVQQQNALQPLNAICQLAYSLRALAECTPDNQSATSMRLTGHRLPELAKLARATERRPMTDQWQVLVPLEKQLTAAIPTLKGRRAVQGDVQAFGADGEILTSYCLDDVTIFRSKDKPKKITFVGNDGRPYPFLCKHEKNDLRKDARLMEFGAMLNQMLERDPDARHCGLQARVFSVLAFTESCGIIEWVNGTRTMRSIIDDLWRRLRPGQLQGPREVKEIYDQTKNAYEAFTKQILPRHPPVLHKWFVWKTDPSTWLSRRLAFSRSQALWCMLGYIVGLGDRHGENILIDETSGRVVHVDFECLFGKGMQLGTPETVPFRLTQNCVAAMGVTGVEGVFRECCELSMKIMREKANKQTLLSVLHAFIADPLIDWTPKEDKQKQQAGNAADAQKQQRPSPTEIAKSTISEVERKLHGMLNVGAQLKMKLDDRASVLMPEDINNKRSLLGRDRGVGLSVAGQVDELLKAAMCKRNLSEMYVGWQPWM